MLLAPHPCLPQPSSAGVIEVRHRWTWPHLVVKPMLAGPINRKNLSLSLSPAPSPQVGVAWSSAYSLELDAVASMTPRFLKAQGLGFKGVDCGPLESVLVWVAVFYPLTEILGCFLTCKPRVSPTEQRLRKSYLSRSLRGSREMLCSKHLAQNKPQTNGGYCHL